MHPTITFRINLASGENDSHADSRSTWLPGELCGENLVRKHGDTFTLSGKKALYLKKLIEDTKVTNVELYIPTEEIEILTGLYVVSGGFTEVNHLNSLHTMDATTAETDFVAAFADEYLYYESDQIAWNANDSLLYHLSYRCRGWGEGSDCGYYFEKINLETEERTEIELTGDEFEWFSGIVWNSETNSFFFSDDNGIFYSISTDGVVTTLAEASSIEGMAYLNSALYGTNGNNVFIVDPVDGSTSNEVSFTNESYSLDEGTGVLASFDGIMWTILWLLEESEEEESISVPYLCKVNPDTGEYYPVHNLPQQFVDLTATGDSLIAITDEDAEELAVNTIFILSSEGEYESVLSLGQTDTAEYDETIAYNPDDGKMYHIANFVTISGGEEEEEVNSVKFNKLDLDTLDLTDITTSGIETGSFVVNGFISDGGNDMYDGGNFLNTNLTNSYDNVKEGQIWDTPSYLQHIIPYTHTKIEDNEVLSFPMDGAVTDGTNYFGSGSTYFTNCYDGLFVLVAKNISISEFFIVGNNGADGGGLVAVDSFSVTVGMYSPPNQYTAFVKKVYNAGDPSINHIIIVPGDGSGITHEYSASTDNDDDHYSGITQNAIYYLLISAESGGEIGHDDLVAITEAFCNTIDGQATTANVLSALNSGYTNVTDLIPNKYTFGDEGVDVRDFEGLSNLYAMTYVGNDIFFLATSNGIYSITTTGEITLLDYTDTIRGLAVLDGVVYAVQSNEGEEGGNFLLRTLDSVTGEFNDEDGNLLVYESFIYNFYGLTTLGGFLYSIVEMSVGEEESNAYKLVKIDVETRELTEVVECDQFDDLASIV